MGLKNDILEEEANEREIRRIRQAQLKRSTVQGRQGRCDHGEVLTATCDECRAARSVQPAPEPSEEWLKRIDHKGRWEVISKEPDGTLRTIVGRLGIYEPEKENATQIVADHHAVPLLVAALKFQQQALAELIDDFGHDGHPRLHAALANMRDDIDAALAAVGQEGKR